MSWVKVLGNWDAWIPPVIELWVGCILLVWSSPWWLEAPAPPVWDRHGVGAILAPVFVYRAWTRKDRA